MYRKLPPEKPLFTAETKKPVSDIASTKEKVKNTLKRLKEEESQKKKKRRSKKVDTSVASVDYTELLGEVVKKQIEKIENGQLFFDVTPLGNANKAQIQTKLFVNESGNVRLNRNSAQVKDYVGNSKIFIDIFEFWTVFVS